jgi:hypothetical protein
VDVAEDQDLHRARLELGYCFEQATPNAVIGGMRRSGIDRHQDPFQAFGRFSTLAVAHGVQRQIDRRAIQVALGVPLEIRRQTTPKQPQEDDLKNILRIRLASRDATAVR